MPVAPATIVFMKFSCTYFQAGDGARRKSEVYGHSALLLGLEMVRVAAGQAFYQGRLAVVDVACSAEGYVLLCRVHSR